MIHAILGLPLDTVRDIGWTLIHFLWQGLILAAVLQAILPSCRGAVARHNWALATLVAMALAPIATFLAIHGDGESGALPTVMPDAPAQSLAGVVDALSSTSSVSTWIEWLVACWIVGIAVLSLRAVGGWYVAESLRRQDTSPLPAELLQRCRALQQRLALTAPVQYLQSRFVRAPVVVGWLRPTVLIPVSAITGLSPQYLDALISHELAHIRRFDAFTNLLLIAVETILFYHPAVWWVSRCVRIAREQCCDDIAVSICGGAEVYVEALTTQDTGHAAPAFVLAAGGGRLKDRAARLLGMPPEKRASSLSVLAGLVVLGLIGGGYALAAASAPNAAGKIQVAGTKQNASAANLKIGVKVFDGETLIAAPTFMAASGKGTEVVFETSQPDNRSWRFEVTLNLKDAVLEKVGMTLQMVLESSGNAGKDTAARYEITQNDVTMPLPADGSRGELNLFSNAEGAPGFKGLSIVLTAQRMPS